MPLRLSKHDERLVDRARAVIREVVKDADMPSAVAKRITAFAVRQRNKGRAAAIRAHPFQGICEKTGKPLDPRDKVLDEMEPERGYAGKVRWICHKCNNSGTRSCG